MHFVPITEADVQSKKKPSGQKFHYPGAPILSGCFITEDCYVGSGYDKTPLLFKRENGQWKYVDKLDAGSKNQKKVVATGKDAFAGKNIYFEHPLDNSVHMKETDSKHPNYINCQKKFVFDAKRVNIISTSDPNGYMNFWDVSKY